ncbi:MAG: hypothetical protein ABUK01_07480 [Leptospirales bacterium]
MDLSGLSMHQAPPFRAVYRFFLTAPVFIATAGIYLAFGNNSVFDTHISSQLAGFVHLVTLGFLTMVMLGALMQMMPVMVGAIIPRPILFSSLVYYPFTIGLLLLVAGFITNAYGVELLWLLLTSFVLLFFSIGLYVITILSRLLGFKVKSPVLTNLKLVVLSLGAAASVGLILVYGKITGNFFAFEPGMLSLHLYWALAGWVFSLINVVSFQIVPMFYVTPEYPLYMKKYSVPLIFTTGILFTFSWVIPETYVTLYKTLVGVVWAVVALYFSTFTLIRLSKRKRKLPDYTLLFWKLSMTMLALVSLFWIIDTIHPLIAREKFFLISGILFLVGFAVSLVNAMMYKIIPFLSWFHPAGKGAMDTPNMKEMLPDKKIKIQFMVFFAALVFLLLSIFYPAWFLKISGSLFIISSVLLWLNLVACVKVYKKYYKKAENQNSQNG